MKYILFFLLIISLKATAQNEQPITKVIIKYYKGYDPFSQTGIYSRGEIFEIYPVEASFFKINHYLKITYRQIDSNTTKKDTIEVRSGSRQMIPRKIIDELIVQLNTTKDNFNISFIKPQLKKPTKKLILAIATKLDENDEFEKDNVDDAKERIAKIRSFDKLDSFINLNKPDPKIALVTVDAWDGVDITCFYGNETVKYRGSLFQLLGQPFGRINPERQIFNLGINKTLKDILPKISVLRTRIDINSLTDAYIEWYIDKVL